MTSIINFFIELKPFLLSEKKAYVSERWICKIWARVEILPGQAEIDWTSFESQNVVEIVNAPELFQDSEQKYLHQKGITSTSRASIRRQSDVGSMHMMLIWCRFDTPVKFHNVVYGLWSKAIWIE